MVTLLQEVVETAISDSIGTKVDCLTSQREGSHFTE